MKREVLRKITATIISFGAAVLLTAALLALVLGAVFSRPYFSLLTGDSYKHKVVGEVLSELEGYAIPGGLPQDFFEEQLDIALLEKDVSRAVKASFNGKSVSFESFSSAARQSVMNYAQENNIVVEAGEDSTEENIDELVSLCSSAYKRLVNSEIIKFGGALSRYLSPWCWVAVLLSAAIAAGLLVATGKIGGKNFVRMALGGSGLMLFILPCYLLIFRNISKLGITSPSMYSLATGVIYSLLGIMIALAVLLLVLANIPYNKKEKPKE